MADSGLLGFAVRKRMEYSLIFFGLRQKRNMDVAGFGSDKPMCFGMGKIQAQESIFEDRYDVIKFIKLAQQHGLYIHLHIGPDNRLRLQNVHRSVLDIHIKNGPSFLDWQY
ncbi:hypothetical protein ACLB2K_045469 [Fragaria x ananassa]